MLKIQASTYTQNFAQRLAENVRQVIVGAHQAIELMTIGLLCQGHLLIEDVPGVGKTVLARSLAQTLGCSYSRIQFTPDILPTDITGVHIFDKATNLFEFQPGPIMAQIVLIDEINRAGPKTQAALLEAMDEKQISVDTKPYPLPNPFLVVATVNRIETQGTYNLPKSQLDRFFIRVQLGYPSPEEERIILHRQKYHHPIENLKQTLTIEDLFVAQQEIKEVYISPLLKRYIVDLVEQTRQHADVKIGGSPRCSMVLYRSSQARAAIYGRGFVLPEDIKALALPTLGHRLLLSPRAYFRKQCIEDILEEILDSTPIPIKRDITTNKHDRLIGVPHEA
jgi:MoxR-like ATPase